MKLGPLEMSKSKNITVRMLLVIKLPTLFENILHGSFVNCIFIADLQRAREVVCGYCDSSTYNPSDERPMGRGRRKKKPKKLTSSEDESALVSSQRSGVRGKTKGKGKNVLDSSGEESEEEHSPKSIPFFSVFVSAIILRV